MSFVSSLELDLGVCFSTKQPVSFYLKKGGVVSLTKRGRTMHLCLETSTSVRQDEGGEC